MIKRFIIDTDTASDDVVAILTRNLVESYDLFTASRVQ